MSELTKLQKKVLSVVFKIAGVRQHFYLTGGTALSAFYLHHRISDDLDLFTHSIEIEIAAKMTEDSLRINNLSFQSLRASPTFRRYVVENKLQLDLVRDVDFRIGAPELIGDIMVDNIKNITMNKVLAIYGRLDAKDYVDLYFICKDKPQDVLCLIEKAKNKDAGIHPFEWARVIADAKSLTVMPKMILPLDIDEMKCWYEKLRELIISSLTNGVACFTK